MWLNSSHIVGIEPTVLSDKLDVGVIRWQVLRKAPGFGRDWLGEAQISGGKNPKSFSGWVSSAQQASKWSCQVGRWFMSLVYKGRAGARNIFLGFLSSTWWHLKPWDWVRSPMESTDERGGGEGGRGKGGGAMDKASRHSNTYQCWNQAHGSRENSVLSSVKWEHVWESTWDTTQSFISGRTQSLFLPQKVNNLKQSITFIQSMEMLYNHLL